MTSDPVSVPATTQRVPGHELEHEGAPYFKDGFRINSGTTSGFGFGLCSCGTFSDWLPSGAARKRWHREHKAEVLENS